MWPEEGAQHVLRMRQCKSVLRARSSVLTGESIPNLKCEGRKRIPLDTPLTYEAVQSVLRELATDCVDHWQSQPSRHPVSA